ncbi:ovotransferrin [Trichonephila clavata]|uniref:Ovotransferrin n=1 Tax=Trichonephila clavata TaxID=2740835 RepID=A0A8X6L8F8_TRICU|nr:ovotransferrin [Trichonephila clavata]
MDTRKWVWILLFICTFLKRAVTNDLSTIVWCTVSTAEQKKCADFSRAVNRTASLKVTLSCQQTTDKDKCMDLIDTGRADLLTLDPGEVYIAGRYNSLVPVVAEVYGSEETSGYYAVVVARESLDIRTLADLRGKRACFPGIGQMAGWVIPISVLIDKDIIEVIDCNNLIKTAASFFGPSCAPNSLIDKYNPTGDNPMHMCDLCAGDKSTRCSGSDPYANFDGAFNCFANGGDIAFLKHTTVDEMTSSQSYKGPHKNQLKLICPTGFTASVDSYKSCNWGYVPSHAVVTTSATHPERKYLYQRFLTQAASKFGNTWNDAGRRWPDNSNPDAADSSFKLFGYSEKYEGRNLLFQDLTVNLIPLEENQQTFSGYLGSVEKTFQQKLQKCPIPSARLCVVSDQEMRKCQKMKTAFRARMLRPDLVCIKGFSQIKCMQLIRENAADLVVLDAGDIYRAGQNYNLMPIVAEQYDLEEPSYYVIAVARQPDKDTDLLYLKGKRSCHTGIGMAAGWVIPMSFLLSSERMRSYGCDSAHAAAEFFQKSCVPGALSREYTIGDTQYNTLCDLCHGSSSYFCSKSSHEPFFGHTGALRCLVEGGGEIAFVKHTTILENTAGKNQEWWSRPMMPDDFELLCRDGTRAAYDMHEQCNLGKVASNAIVTDRMKPKEYINAYIDLFLYAQQYYGSKYSEEFTFKMFVSEDDFSDLIFQDATQQLKIVPESKRDYRNYLGREFLLAMKIVDCTASSTLITASISNIALLFLVAIFCSNYFFIPR